VKEAVVARTAFVVSVAIVVASAWLDHARASEPPPTPAAGELRGDGTSAEPAGSAMTPRQQARRAVRLQAWDYAYNKSIPWSNPQDKYPWISLGIRVLVAEAAKHPDDGVIAHDVGWFVAQKIGRSDDASVFRQYFADDGQLQKALMVGFRREDVLGPSGKPDNWLVARQWFLCAERLLPEMPDADLSPIVYRSEAPMCRAYFAAAIEREGVFGEAARRAWKVAADDWHAFGEQRISTPRHVDVQLNRFKDYDDKRLEADIKLKAMEPQGLRETLKAEKLKNLKSEERDAWQTPAEKRTPQQRELTWEVEQRTRVDYVEIAQRITGENHARAHKLALEAMDYELMAANIRRERSIVNFDYWEMRAQAEQEDEMLQARQATYHAEQAIRGNDSARTRALCEEALLSWLRLIDNAKYAVLFEDQATEDELFGIVAQYLRALGRLGEAVPAKLKGLVERYGKDRRDAKRAVDARSAEEVMKMFRGKPSSEKKGVVDQKGEKQD
jgi:hypothetical protein